MRTYPQTATTTWTCIAIVSLPALLTNAFSIHPIPRRSLLSSQTQFTRLHADVTQDTPPPPPPIPVPVPVLKDGEIDIHPEQIEIKDMDAITTLAGNIVQCLFKSDLKRKGGGDGGGSTGWTSWVDDPTAFSLRCCIDSLAISKPINPKDISERDETNSWLRWMKSSPSPLMIDLSHQVRDVANGLIRDEDMDMIETTREDFVERIGVNLILLPSGKTLDQPIRTPPGAMAYGKLLYGGANRYRILPGKMKRRTGERTALITKEGDNVDAWLQYGGPERNYEAVDMGACCLLEVIVLPTGLKTNLVSEEIGHMALSDLKWEAKKMISFWEAPEEYTIGEESEEMEQEVDPLLTLSGQDRNDFMTDAFTQNVGGLQTQIESIVRRVLDGRVYLSEDGEKLGSQSLTEAQELESLGLTAVRGLLLYGPPGCGKTALAREISNALRARQPKVVSAPELLDRWVGK